MLELIRVGSRWIANDRTARVMAVAEGYVMYRFKGCSVNVVYWKDFLKRFTGPSPGKLASRTFVAAGPEQGMSTMCECGQTFSKHIAQDSAGNACVCP